MLNYPTLLLSVKCQMKSPSVLYKTIHTDKAHWQCILGRSAVFGAVLQKALGFILQRGYVCAQQTRKSVNPVATAPEFQVHTDPLKVS